MCTENANTTSGDGPELKETLCSALSADVLNVKIEGDFEGTLREFFKELALKVWEEGECFSGKRPFGNSGWDNAVYEALVKAEHIEGTLNEDGYLEDCDWHEADRLVLELVRDHF